MPATIARHTKTRFSHFSSQTYGATTCRPAAPSPSSATCTASSETCCTSFAAKASRPPRGRTSSMATLSTAARRASRSPSRCLPSSCCSRTASSSTEARVGRGPLPCHTRDASRYLRRQPRGAVRPLAVRLPGRVQRKVRPGRRRRRDLRAAFPGESSLEAAWNGPRRDRLRALLRGLRPSSHRHDPQRQGARSSAAAIVTQ